MKIIIAGAGEVGFQLAKMLADEEHDIILIDMIADRLSHAESHIDVGTIRGNSVSIKILEDAGVDGADLLIAATSSETTNITTAIIGKNLGARRTIARISNPEFQVENKKLNMEKLGIDSMVFPEDLAAKEIHRLIQRSVVTDSFEFGQGQLTLTGIILEGVAPILDQSLMELVASIPDLPFTVVAIQRANKTIIPRGETRFRPYDHVYFISHPDGIDDIIRLTGKSPVKIKNIMILGGSLIGRLFALKAQNEYSIKLIDSDREKCYQLADELSQALVLHGNGNDVELLEEEGISDMDAFLAVTGNSETNIISCLVAKNHGVKRAIALVENIDYISLSQNIGIDTLINKKLIAANNIFRFVREGQVEALTSLHGVESELLEFSVSANCKITHKPIRKLDFPRDAVIAGVIRGDESFTASGDLQILEGDHVVIFTLPSAIHRVEQFFKN